MLAYHIKISVVTHVLRNRHLQKHHTSVVLHSQVLVTGLDVTLLPYRYLPRHLLLVDLG